MSDNSVSHQSEKQLMMLLAMAAVGCLLSLLVISLINSYVWGGLWNSPEVVTTLLLVGFFLGLGGCFYLMIHRGLALQSGGEPSVYQMVYHRRVASEAIARSLGEAFWWSSLGLAGGILMLALGTFSSQREVLIFAGVYGVISVLRAASDGVTWATSPEGKRGRALAHTRKERLAGAMVWGASLGFAALVVPLLLLWTMEKWAWGLQFSTPGSVAITGMLIGSILGVENDSWDKEIWKVLWKSVPHTLVSVIFFSGLGVVIAYLSRGKIEGDKVVRLIEFFLLMAPLVIFLKGVIHQEDES